MESESSNDFEKILVSLRETLANFKENVSEKIMEQKKASGDSTNVLAKPEVEKLAKANIVEIVKMRIQYRNLQIVLFIQ